VPLKGFAQPISFVRLMPWSNGPGVSSLSQARLGRRVQSEPHSLPRWGGKVDRLTDWARRGVEAFHGLSLLQLGLLAALGLGLGYWVLGVGLRSI
jgi:hypothetical protein